MNEPALIADDAVRMYQGFYAAHSHEYSQILLDLEGRAARVDAATGLVVPAGYQHSYTSDEDPQVWVVNTTRDQGLEKPRAFQLPADWKPSVNMAEVLLCVDEAPRVLQRRCVNPVQTGF